jgi:hypothetical protein
MSRRFLDLGRSCLVHQNSVGFATYLAVSRDYVCITDHCERVAVVIMVVGLGLVIGDAGSCLDIRRAMITVNRSKRSALTIRS